MTKLGSFGPETKRSNKNNRFEGRQNMPFLRVFRGMCASGEGKRETIGIVTDEAL